jgi:enoyl-CoA hydratase/carnithine racemase
MTDQLKTSQTGQTLVLTLSNPDLRNALGPHIYAAAIEALDAAERNPGIRSIILTGEGEHFCAGGDLHRLLANRAQDRAVQSASIDNLNNLIETLCNYPKPVIAAVEGAAAGAGFSLALAADMIVSARNAVFVMAYSNVALSPDGGGTWHLMQKLPPNLAFEWMLTGERQTAEQLCQFGVINRLVDPGAALASALQLAEIINSKAPNVMSSIKELAQSALKQDLHAQLELEKAHFVNNLHHANGGIGISAFLQKTKPLYP